jgi:hypothetical protein
MKTLLHSPHEHFVRHPQAHRKPLALQLLRRLLTIKARLTLRLESCGVTSVDARASRRSCMLFAEDGIVSIRHLPTLLAITIAR